MVPEQLDIETITRDGWKVVRVKGEIDLASVGELENEVGGLIESGTTRIIIDLTGVTFLDSTGLRTLLATHSRLAQLGGTLALVLNGGPVERLLDITGVADTFTVYPTLEAAAN